MNLAALSLLPAALVGMAATIFGLWWLRVVHALLPGTIPASELALPSMLVAAGFGSTLIGRLADRRPWLFATTAKGLGCAALAVLGAGWLADALAPAPTAPALMGWARLGVAGLPVFPALFLMAGVLPGLSLARARRGVPVGRATGSVVSALGCGGAFGATLFGEILVSPAGPRAWSALCLAAAALACRVLARLPGPTRPWSSDRRANPMTGLETVGLLAWLVTGGVLFLAGQQGLQRMVEQRLGASLAATMAVLVAVQIGIAAGSGALAWAPRQLPAGVLACACLLVSALALTIPGIAWRHAATTSGVIALIAPLGMGCGSLVTAASRARVRRPERLGSWLGDLFALWLAGGLVGLLAYTWRWSPDPELGTAGILHVLAAVAVATAAVAALLSLLTARVRVVRIVCGVAAVVTLASWVAAMGVDVPELPLRSADTVELLRSSEGLGGIVALTRTDDGGVRLQLDSQVDLGGTSRAALDRRLGRLACALVPGAERVAVIGVGSGEILASAAATTRGRVDGIEASDQIVELALPLPVDGIPVPRRSPSFAHADSRAWLLEHPDTYDLVIVSPAVPWAPGAADLLTRDAFLIMRRALKPDGAVVQWVDLSQTPWPALGAVTKAFLDAFPTTRLFVATPLSGRVVVGLMGALEADLPDLDEIEALLAPVPTVEGPNGADDVVDAYLTDQWGLATSLADLPENTPGHPWSELLAWGRLGQEERLAAINLRLLADLAQPLETSALRRRPTDDKERVQLGRRLASRSEVTAQLLAARADALELAYSQTHPVDPTLRLLPDELEALQRSIDRRLLMAWQASPGHPTVRAAILERGLALQADQGVEALGSLLESALAIHADGRLAGAYGGALLAIGHDENALTMLREARKLAPDDRTTLLHLGAALVRNGADAEGAEVWRSVAARFGPGGLPPMQTAILALLDHQPGARAAARRIAVQLPRDEPWRAVLERLLEAE